LLIGSVHLPVVSGFLFVLFLLFIHQYRVKALKSSQIGILAIGLALLAFLQLLPAPLSFSVEDLSLFQLAQEKNPITWRPLSTEPYFTADRGLRFLCLGLLAFVIASIQSRKFYQRATFWLLIGGWVTLAFGVFLWISQITDLFGFEQSVRFRGPSSFVNTNHGASYFALLTLAALIYNEDNETPYFSIVSGFTFLIAFILHASMGVNLVFCFVFSVYLLLKFRPSRRTLFLSIGLLSLLFSSFVLLTSLEIIPSEYFQRFLHHSSSRWELTKAGIGLAAEWPILGAGLGSTDTSILPHINWENMAPASIPTLENEILEFFGTGGILAGLMILGGHLYILACAIKTFGSQNAKRRHRWYLLVWILFLGIAVLHFPWFTIGLGFPFILLIQSTSTHSTFLVPKHSKGEQKETNNRPHILLGLITLFLVFFSANAFFWHQREDIIARPFSSKAWINLATKEIKEKHFELALLYAEKANAVDPRPKTTHYLARVVAKNANFDRSTKLYTRAFKRGAINNRLITDMLGDLKEPEMRNRVLANQGALVWRRAAKITQTYFSVDQAVELAFDAIKNHTHEKEAKDFVVALFIDLDQIELAKIWTQTQNLNEGILATIYLKEGDFDSFFKSVSVATQSGHRPDAYLLKNHEAILKGGKRGMALIKKLVDHYCKKPLKGDRHETCWRVEARLKIEEGDVAGAKKMYLRIYHRSGNPLSLAKFYAGQKACSSVQGLIDGQGKEKYKKSLSKLLRRCSQH